MEKFNINPVREAYFESKRTQRTSMKIPLRYTHTQLPLPKYATSGSAAVDLSAALEAPKRLWPGETFLAPTGIAIHIENKSVAGLIIPRSGLGHNYGLVLGNGVGLIDSDYQGEILVSLFNRSPVGTPPIEIKPLDRIAQLIFIRVEQIQFNVVDSFTPSERGENGYGSSGV
jgi:dUTP diphosphatase